MSAPPLSVLDLVPVPSGGTAAQALRDTADLARRTEECGYHRYWLAEHHLNPGVAGTSPALLIQWVAQATTRIRVGSGAALLGHRTALSVVEEFGILDALHPGRIDLGLGRSGGPPPGAAGATARAPGAGPGGAPPDRPDRGGPGDGARSGAAAGQGDARGHHTEEGLYLPPPFRGVPALLDSPRLRAQRRLLRPPSADPPPYARQVDDILALLDGSHRTEGVDIRPVPGTGADLDVWVLGSSAGTSAEVAGARGLPFGANYHVSPGSVLEAAGAYRAAFRPSAARDRPYLLVSADVVVAPDRREARRIAAGYAAWVRSIRSGDGAIPYPSPAEAEHLVLSDADRRLVADRVDTRFVGDPRTVADELRVLLRATGADEVLVTTVTHDPADRLRSYELLAEAWSARG